MHNLAVYINIMHYKINNIIRARNEKSWSDHLDLDW